MKGTGSTLAVAFGLANLYLLFLTGPLVSPQHQLIFHLPGSATVLFLPALLDLLAATLFLFGLLQLTRPFPRLELVVWSLLLLPLPLVLVETIAAFSGRPPGHLALWPALFFLGAGLGFVLLRSATLVPVFRRARPGLATLFGFLSLSGFVLLAQLGWFAWKARDLNPPFVFRKPTPGNQPRPGSPRVVWIILDELSYRQLYGHRLPGLALPNFDRLASEASVFTQAEATAQYTRIAVPSLLTGQSLTATSPTADGRRLLLHPRGAHHWTALSPENTVFGDVERAGLPTAVAGWYEPYCRILPSVLDRCFWTYRDNIPGDLSGSGSVLSNAIQPFRTAALVALHVTGLGPGIPPEGTRDVRRHAADFQSLVAAGDGMLQSQTAGLLLLHMPVPHPWGFYDRRTGTFPDHRTSYLDNLALADAYLGHIIALLTREGSWDNTTVIVMGDHGWRTHAVWKDSGFWTDEEQRASRGSASIDPPAVLVKLAGQHQGARIDTRFEAVRTRDLIDEVIAGKLIRPEDVKAWVASPAPSAASVQR